MSRTNKALSVLVVSFLGLWGCAQGPTNSTGQTERVKKLEDKCARLEEDFRLRSIERDDARKLAAGLEQDKTKLTDERARLQKELDQLKLVVKERDRLRQEVEIKTARCEKLKAGLKNLITEDDAMLTVPPAVTTTASATGGGR
jgi:chromosome segregation ATPase